MSHLTIFLNIALIPLKHQNHASFDIRGNLFPYAMSAIFPSRIPPIAMGTPATGGTVLPDNFAIATRQRMLPKQNQKFVLYP